MQTDKMCLCDEFKIYYRTVIYVPKYNFVVNNQKLILNDTEVV